MNVLKIEYVATDDLIPYINNSRTHSESQIKQIAASISEFGFTNPILIDDSGSVIAGHGRLMAADILSLKKVPTITLEGLTDTQRKAYVIADNKLALNSGWDIDVLGLELSSLADLNFNVDIIGFDSEELESILNQDVEPLEEFPELPDGEKEPYQQKTFTLHDEQAGIVDDAVMLARKNPLADSDLNDNSNANALSFICEQWLKSQHE